MFCSRCGSPIPEGAPFCPNCGARQAADPSAPAPSGADQQGQANYPDPAGMAGQANYPNPANYPNSANYPAPGSTAGQGGYAGPAPGGYVNNAAPGAPSAPVPPMYAPYPPAPPKKKFPVWGIILPIVIALVAGGVVLWSTLSQKNNTDANNSSPAAAEESSPAQESSQAGGPTIEDSSEASASMDSSEESAASQAQENSEYAESSEGPAPESSEEAPEGSSESEASAPDESSESSAEESSEEESSEEEPAASPVRIELVSTDISDYPTVRIYLRIISEDTGEAAEGVTAQEITLQEKISGGKFVVREVKKAEQLANNQGLHIALVADKSDSIEDYDMEKIKTVMSDFVDHLNFEVGDMAEVLAFDSIVQQMCFFTDQPDLLKNGINYMSTDGMTALYDAIHDGVNHAALEGGARCVIAFTDGMDNESRYTPDQIIEYANESQVPVYIIGVGSSVDEGILKRIAERTGGHYWFIDDLYDLEEIYREIYEEQMDIYVIEYESEAKADTDTEREIELTLSGSFIGELEATFTPVISIIREHHDSRYEVFNARCSWEEASQWAREKGGHLATITSQDEMDTLVELCEDKGLTYIWIGGYTSYDDDGEVFGHWITGEEFSYEAWAKGEPSRNDLDGTPEWYLMLWNIPSLGGWTWNDQRNAPAEVAPKMTDDTMGYIVEYE